MRRHPPDILITTPESLYLMLTSRGRETLARRRDGDRRRDPRVAATKRGAHLALSLERLDAIADRAAQRIGLSATQRPLEEIAPLPGRGRGARPVTIVDAGARKELDIEVIVPVDDMTDPDARAALRRGAERAGPRAGAVESGRRSTRGCSS